ncbi:MAG: ribonuclease H-like domain-containing protein [Clostridia bacterium]|nr:ribonuclease H-like domain-containing protein [Clostridia bacterium]
MANLLNKLRMLDAAPKKTPSKPVDTKKDFACYRSQSLFPLSLFTNHCHARQDILQAIFGCPFPAEVHPEDILFLDTETTGLSGGAGTIAFQIGAGYFTASGFVVEQFLIHDYPEEAEMLRLVDGLMQRFPILCTFNGRTFDIPLLKSRFQMNRISNAHIPNIHADVLYPARRIWKLRLKNCRLSNLEEQLLHVQRDDDLPGALVPQTYFQYLKDGNFDPLLKILEHNKQDIVSLAQLFYFMCRQVDKPEEIEAAEDLFSLARSMEKTGEKSKAMKCYHLSAASGMAAEACLAMARIEKREGNCDAAVKLYQSMLLQDKKSVAACEGLAKLYEHQLKDLPKAVSYTRQALLLLSEPALFKNETVQEQQKALQYRYARLRRKLSKQTT